MQALRFPKRAGVCFEAKIQLEAMREWEQTVSLYPSLHSKPRDSGMSRPAQQTRRLPTAKRLAHDEWDCDRRSGFQEGLRRYLYQQVSHERFQNGTSGNHMLVERPPQQVTFDLSTCKDWYRSHGRLEQQKSPEHPAAYEPQSMLQEPCSQDPADQLILATLTLCSLHHRRRQLGCILKRSPLDYQKTSTHAALAARYACEACSPDPSCRCPTLCAHIQFELDFVRPLCSLYAETAFGPFGSLRHPSS